MQLLGVMHGAWVSSRRGRGVGHLARCHSNMRPCVRSLPGSVTVPSCALMEGLWIGAGAASQLHRPV